MKLVRSTGCAAIALAALGWSGIASADNGSMTINYFTLSESDQDTGSGQCCSNPTNLVTGSLGADGLPVYAGGATPAIKDLTPSNEITWWSPALNPNVTATGSATVALPFGNNSFFPTNGTGSNDANGYQTAELSGTFTLAAANTVTFNVNSDDDAFVYVNGTLVGQNGGVHPATSASYSDSLGVGTYSLNVFYADRDQTQAVLDFSVNGATVDPVPEPSTWALMIAGMAMLGGYAYRQRKSMTPLVKFA
jgi:fibro-slime domain-containing protein